MQKIKKRLHSFSFKGKNHAVALVSKDVGGAANQYTTLLMKSGEEVSMTSGEYLEKLTGILNETPEVLQENHVELLKGLDTADESKVAEILATIATDNGIVLSDIEKSTIEVEENVGGEAPTDELEIDKSTSPSQEDNSMEIEEVLKAKEELQKQLDNATAQLEVYKQAEAQAVYTQYEDLVKGLESVEEADVKTMTIAVVKASLDEDLAPLVELVKAQDQLIKGMNGAEPQGHGAEVDTPAKSDDLDQRVMNILKSQTNK